MKTSTVLLAVVALGVVGCGGRHEDLEQAPLPAVTARLARVDAVEILRRVELYGSVGAEKVTAVSSRVMATVTAVKVQAGDRVRAGQVLVEIDPDTANGQEAQARGALAQAQAGLALAQRNHERFQALAAQKAASELELDMARMQYEQAKGAVEQAQGAVESASSVARESQVVAPFAGRVAQKLVEVGDLAAPGRPLVLVESERGRRLVVSVPESVVAAAGLALGAVVPVRLDAFAGLGELPGRVVEMAPGADPMSHTFMVKVEIEDTGVPTGAAGRAWLTAGARTAVVVPSGAVLQVGGVTMVVVRDGEGRARSRAVTLGSAVAGDRVEVLSGVAAGEEVLVGLSAAPADGAPVQEVRS